MKQKTHTIKLEREGFKHRILCLAVASAFGSVVHANPTGPVVANGR